MEDANYQKQIYDKIEKTNYNAHPVGMYRANRQMREYNQNEKKSKILLIIT